MEQFNNSDNNFSYSKGESIDLGEIFWKFFSHWRWILLSVIFCSTAGYVYYKMQPDIYQVSATVLIKSNDDKSSSIGESKLLDELGVKSGGNVENEVEIFRSKRLLYGIIDSLNLNVSYYYETIWANRLHALYKASPIKIKHDVGVYKKLTGSLIFSISRNNNGSFSLEGTYLNERYKLDFNNLPTTISTSVGVFYFERDNQYGLLDRPLIIRVDPTKSIIRGISFQSSVGKKNDVITLTTTSNNVDKGIDLLNTLIKSYNNDAMAQINRASLNTAEFIDSRLKLLTVELSDVERSVEQYKKDNKFTEINAEATAYMSKSTELDRRRIENETQLRLVRFVEDFINSPKNENSPIPNLGLTDQGLSSSLQKFNEMLMTRMRISESTSEDNPVLDAMTKQIDAYRKAIKVGVKNATSALLIAQEDIRKEDSQAAGRLKEIPRQEREFIEIKRQQQIKEQLYIFLLQKREESALTMALTVPKAIVINDAEYAGQISPNRNLIYMVAFMIGFLFPLMIIYLLDLFNDKIYSRREIERMTRVPILAEMSHSDSDHLLSVSYRSLDSTTELFRLLRARLNFILKKDEEKIILITSTVPGEGKTFMSINLAVSLAMADKKVLIVGLDLRRPQLALKFNLKSKEGITSYLSDQEENVDEFISKSLEYDNLYILPAGIIPPNPNELLLREKLELAFEKFRKEYDYVIIDSAPVGVVSDGFLINRVADVTLYICRAAFSHRKNFEIINRIAYEKSFKRLFVILNDLKLANRYYKHGTYYGYSEDDVKPPELKWYQANAIYRLLNGTKRNS